MDVLISIFMCHGVDAAVVTVGGVVNASEVVVSKSVGHLPQERIPEVLLLSSQQQQHCFL